MFRKGDQVKFITTNSTSRIFWERTGMVVPPINESSVYVMMDAPVGDHGAGPFFVSSAEKRLCLVMRDEDPDFFEA